MSNGLQANWMPWADIGLVAFVFSVLLWMVLPLKPWMLDLLLAVSISSGLLVMLVIIYVREPSEFTAFPTLLLIITLFRLGINVASTRLILGEAQAGQIIQKFGEVVVQNNYVVGFVVFIILTLINFVVITKGAGRIAEVAARFTLDAMPGKQMAIDAELNAGLIKEDQARIRREELAKETEFLVLARPGHELSPPPELNDLRMRSFDTSEFDVSSSQIRNRIRNHLPFQELVPPPVASIITERKLYH